MGPYLAAFMVLENMNLSSNLLQIFMRCYWPGAVFSVSPLKCLSTQMGDTHGAQCAIRPHCPAAGCTALSTVRGWEHAPCCLARATQRPLQSRSSKRQQRNQWTWPCSNRNHTDKTKKLEFHKIFHKIIFWWFSQKFKKIKRILACRLY